jgi:hypothetical protein
LKNAALMLTRAGELLEVAHQVDPDIQRQLQSVLTQNENLLVEARARLDEVAVGPRVTLAPSLNKVHGEARRAAS